MPICVFDIHFDKRTVVQRLTLLFMATRQSVVWQARGPFTLLLVQRLREQGGSLGMPESPVGSKTAPESDIVLVLARGVDIQTAWSLWLRGSQ